MAGVTQRVGTDAVDDLLEQPPRAAIAFARGASVEPVPVAYRRSEGRSLVGLRREWLPPGGAPERAVLLLDDGRYWFELRAVTMRGRLEPSSAQLPGGEPHLVWFEFTPDRTVAWDYGALREENGA